MGRKVEEGPPQPASPPAPLQRERGVISLVFSKALQQKMLEHGR